ncbi:MAG: hypothetical protein ACFFGZ_00385 [Candidatus Thorarchaeota archaeon]
MLSPPLIIVLCLLASLALLSTIILNLLVVLLSSLYSRRLSAYEESYSPCELQNDKGKAIKHNSNAVVYRSHHGPEILAFYKVLRRPQNYSLDELRAAFGTSNLTIYPIIHANGSFLAFRFAENSHSYQNNSVWEIPNHLDELARTISMQVPGLELVPASLPDVKRLLEVFGLRINDTQNGIHSKSADIRRTNRDLLSNSGNSPLNSNNELENAISHFEKATATIESIQGDPNSVPITPTGKQIAERLVIKDLSDLLGILQSLANLPESVQDKIATCQAYLNVYIDNSSKNGITTPNTLWKHVPGAVELIEEILEELLGTYEGNHGQGEGKIQPV